MSYAIARSAANGDRNRLAQEDRAIHEWYRFVLSFPPQLVRNYLLEFDLSDGACVLDPFCGTGTTLVECQKAGIASVGIEAYPLAHFAAQVKLDWTPDPDALLDHARVVAQRATVRLAEQDIEDNPLFDTPCAVQPERLTTLTPEREALLLANSISPLPLHKALILLETLEAYADPRFHDHERLALAKSVVAASSNLRFGPEVGVGRIKLDAPVISPWLDVLHGMAHDLRSIHELQPVQTQVYHADARQLAELLAPHSIDAVITSPPYPNEKDYTRTTRLEAVLLGFLQTKQDLRSHKQRLLRSNTRTVYKGDSDDLYVDGYSDLQRLADEIEARRIALGKTSGFERLYARVTRLYFGGMARHLAELRSALKPGARLAYVVGDQASYLQVLIQTGQHLAHIATSLGYTVERIDQFRTRSATATSAQLNEEVVVLRWPGIIAATMSNHHQSVVYDDASISQRSTRSMDMPESQRAANRYSQIVERIFQRHYTPGATEVAFERDELATTAAELGVSVPLNLGDIPYSFRYRQPLPEAIRATAPEGKEWIIRSVGRSRYQFTLREKVDITPNPLLVETRIPDATPGLVAKYAVDDEQGLLARLRYNRLIDIFTRVTCYSLQNHLRTTVPNIGQVETDEIYVGLDRSGAHYVFPVQAKGGSDRLGIVQIEQDMALCEHRFPGLICRPIAAQFLPDGAISLFAFEKQDDLVKIAAEQHYRLVAPSDLTDDELASYRQRTSEA